VYGPFPRARPFQLRRRTVAAGTVFWRFDAADPLVWEWSAFPKPRFRFDPADGTFRTRYGASSVVGAARERYYDTGRLIPADHAEHRLVRLTASRPLSVLDLRTERNLTELVIDDRISTGHEPQVWAACQELVVAARGWWAQLDAILYRPRTTPQSSVNMVFFATDCFTMTSRRLQDCRDVLDELVLLHQFTIGFAY
jgi:hypothetical protein